MRLAAPSGGGRRSAVGAGAVEGVEDELEAVVELGAEVVAGQHHVIGRHLDEVGARLHAGEVRGKVVVAVDPEEG